MLYSVYYFNFVGWVFGGELCNFICEFVIIVRVDLVFLIIFSFWDELFDEWFLIVLEED